MPGPALSQFLENRQRDVATSFLEMKNFLFQTTGSNLQSCTTLAASRVLSLGWGVFLGIMVLGPRNEALP